MDASVYEAAGLYDPGADGAPERLALLEFLEASAVPIDDMVAAHAQGRLTAAAGDRLLRPGERISLREVARRAEMPLELADRAWRAVGLGGIDPDVPHFAEREVGTFVAFAGATEVFGEAAILEFTRVAATSMARIAETAVASFLAEVQRPLQEEGAGELALAQANLMVGVAFDSAPGVLETFFRHHLQAAIKRFHRARVGLTVFDTVRLAVGFVDLVGFTPLARELPTSELTRMVATFEERAFHAATSHNGQIVKLIGDEVMFTAVDAADACEIALVLFETLGEERAVTPRGGLAVGNLLTRAGDYYGPMVNLASRIAGEAVPGEILVTTDLRDAVEPASRDYRFDPAGRRLPRGFPEPVALSSLSRAAQPEGPPSR